MIHREFAQHSEEWWMHRMGSPTASEFSRLLTPAKLEPSKQLEDYAMELAAEAFSRERVNAWRGNADTEHGNLTEAEGRAYYRLITGNEVEEVGLISNTIIGAKASPDGLTGYGPTADCYRGVLEIKCPAAKQHITCLQHTECPRDYLLQCQGQILVGWEDGVRWADLLIYSTTLPPKIFRVEADQRIHELLKAQIDRVNERKRHYLEIIKEAA